MATIKDIAERTGVTPTTVSRVVNNRGDMFWTSHPDSKKHSFLRAVSGGPVYFSNRIGDTDLRILEPLMYQDGEDMSDKVRKVSTYLYELDLPVESDKCAITVLWDK